MKSMTGYGYSRMTQDTRCITVEIRSVNHRYLDIAPRLPKNLLFLEETLTGTIKSRISRGHIDVYVDYRNTVPGIMKIDKDLVERYRDGIDQISALIGREEAVLPSFYAMLPDVMRVEPVQDDADAVKALLLSALDEAIDSVVVMREREGKKLRDDILMYASSISATVDLIAEAAPSVPLKYQKRLEKRLSELKLHDIDPVRIAQEVGMMADRCAVDEEIARLRSHITQIRTVCDQESACGKQMDFIVQEMNREMNTIGSKASDEAISKMVISGKNDIEKLREQVQNVE